MYRYLAMVFAVLISSPAYTKEIPLKSLHALNMKDIPSVYELEPKLDRSRLSKAELLKVSDVEKLRVALSKRPKGVAGPVLVVPTEVALKAANGILKGEEMPRWLPTDTDLSLVFYAFLNGRYIWINNVEREGNLITIKFEAVQHTSADMTQHFALIPLGKLAPGTYHVKVEEVPSLPPDGKTATPLPNKRGIISDSMSFGVRESKEER